MTLMTQTLMLWTLMPWALMTKQCGYGRAENSCGAKEDRFGGVGWDENGGAHTTIQAAIGGDHSGDKSELGCMISRHCGLALEKSYNTCLLQSFLAEHGQQMQAKLETILRTTDKSELENTSWRLNYQGNCIFSKKAKC